MLNVPAELAELALIVAGLYVAIGLVARRVQPAWSGPRRRRRLAILWALLAIVLAVKVSEDVLSGESGPIDRALLDFVQGHGSPALTHVFAAITLTGSAAVLLPLTSITALALLIARRRFEAGLVVVSTLGGAATVYAIKTLVGRARPDLPMSSWYWGSSFPSGHTLVVAAFAAATALVAARLWPASRVAAVTLAFVWVLLVAASRLVLGVHWPTDVLAAACLGATLPLTLSLALDRGRV